ncbi:MAG: hypothetical protein KGZ39_01270 [Simkania sp.]|nr:hypothetical protein [Simkania sp.]
MHRLAMLFWKECTEISVLRKRGLYPSSEELGFTPSGIKGMPGSMMCFTSEANGKVGSMSFVTPNGSFSFKVKQAE